jgi:hypothetical protein
MISDILTEQEKKQISKKYIDALSGLSEPINNIVKPKMKHFYIYHLRRAGLKDSEARKMGFKFSKHLTLIGHHALIETLDIQEGDMAFQTH